MRSTLDTVAAIGLAVGGALGMAGTFVASDALRETLWTIDGVGIVVATALLTMKYQRLGNELVAAGFLTFLAGESLFLGAREQFQQKCAAVLRPELRTNKKTLLPTSAPLPALGYPFLVLTFIGWIWTLLQPER
ncbi:hypothetical protein EOA75_22995 [Mesorhizobium sp. M1A.F.Ca.IN.022.07.1.1]|uniref:hypothetical protein n=1 Tax=unclassified Mesorhizobium TaxID=325217 RepID=UPI000FCC0DD5|nr:MULTISPECIES: hypothetical protein [unclassified Mesorhizobium]RUV89889.1 hypothetical protein EOA75_22995 [Mesorhizobium sp. M1A.F.Ca.IN.022.07.1.1]RWG01643.1 MAG: hypothetical protein EOQ54_22590 [Mesorhizobium sp.]RWG97341.1 MAG: hypothetical protein EOQ72_19180 [Mesorhizobium sp.]TIR91735.1 MAG: hypothetical protein E5X08_17435 [Mesorhizobium sp.]